jgi:hypothetical protein
VLFYSGNAYNSGRYFINYATADALYDEFVKNQGELLNQHTLDDEYQNPGGEDVLHTHRHDYLVFHAYTTPTRRAMFVVRLSWNHHDPSRKRRSTRSVRQALHDRPALPPSP